MTFTHPDNKLQRISRYYISLYSKEEKNHKHSLSFLSRFAPSYFLIENPFSFDDERYPLYPNKGWIDEDYDRILTLNLSEKEDLEEFRLIAANMARIIVAHPDKFKSLKDYPHFDAILEFILIEGLYEYFSIDIEELLLVCMRHKLVKAGDCGAITLSKNLIFKTWWDSLTRAQRWKFRFQKTLFKVNQRFF